MGTLGYLQISGGKASAMDALYMTFITVATIGFGEIVDLSHHPLGRLFTVFLSVVGIGTMSYLFSTFVALLLESDLNAVLRRKRMEKEIARLRGHYIVCGIGRVGSNVAHELLNTRRALVVIESNREALVRWLEHRPDTLHLHGDAADDELLRTAGVMSAAGVFAVTSDDSHNLMVSLSVKLLNPKARVVARVHDVRNVDKCRRAGADEIVSPDFTGGMRIASAMLRPNAVHVMDMMLHTEENLRVEEVVVPRAAAGATVEALGRRREWLLVAIRDAQSRWHFNPGPETKIAPGDTIVAIVSPEGRRLLELALGAPSAG